MLYSNTVIAYLPPEKDKSICTLTINSVPVCSIYSEESAKLLVATLQELQKGFPASDDSYMGIFEQIIHQEISVKPYIPAKFISNALTNFKLNLPVDEILVMVDDTLADSCKNGLILTKNFLYVKALLKDTYAIGLSRETDVQLDSEKQIVVNGTPIFKFTSSDLNGPRTFVRGLQCLISTLEGTQKTALEMKISKIVHVRFHKAPYIPQDKLLNAIKEYAQDAKPEEVLCLFDDSLRENGKAGVLLTKDNLYVCTRVLQLKRVTKASFKDMLSMFYKKKITISQNDEIACKGSDLLINGDIVCSLDNDGKEIVPQLVKLLDLMKNCQ